MSETVASGRASMGSNGIVLKNDGIVRRGYVGSLLQRVHRRDEHTHPRPGVEAQSFSRPSSRQGRVTLRCAQ